MYRTLASSLLTVLLVTTLLWGGCVSCEQYFMGFNAKSCCSPDGRCKTRLPAGKKTSLECKQIAFEHHHAIDTAISRPITSAVLLDLPAPPMEPRKTWLSNQLTEPSPPDLQVLHATFLI